MDEITLKQFKFTQPEQEITKATDKDYLRLANRLLNTWRNRRLMPDIEDDLKKVICIGLTGYYQDVISDAGVYRAFTDECLRLFGKRVPFHEPTEDYIDYELNREDVEFVLWYELCFNSMKYRYLAPDDAKLLTLADALFKVLEDEYDEIPDPEGYNELFDCELYDPEDAEKLHDLSQWLFWKNWLLLPAFQLTFAQIYQHWMELQQSQSDPLKAKELIEADKQDAMAEMPTGPLALKLREWLHLILKGKMPKKRKQPLEAEVHPWYKAFMDANNMHDIRFIKTYDELNDFLINGMGWAKDEKHLPNLEKMQDFVLMVTPDRGLMVAHSIARCVNHPLNPFYDKDYASDHAFELLSKRAVCPGDMLRFFIKNDCLPDAHFPHSANKKLVADNADFIARAYLQEYYRAED